MTDALNQLRERISWFRETRPGYTEMLDFYEALCEAQDEASQTLQVEPVPVDEILTVVKLREGFPILRKESDFVVDVRASRNLFQSVVRLGPKAPAKLAEELGRIGEAVSRGALDPGIVLERHADAQFLHHTADRLGLDGHILAFLVRASVGPSIRANVTRFRETITLDVWAKGYCPACGSHPRIAELKGEGGKRYVLCSYCGFEWRIPRLMCPFCGNQDHDSLHYFVAEEEESHRVDVCDRCHQYLKTVDSRNLNYDLVLELEDLMTVHLDLAAMRKGFQRVSPVLWSL